jgi:ATP-dependent helicase/nuclease subunit B
MSPRIYTVPPGQPFLASLARAVLHGDLPSAGGARPDLLSLAGLTLLLPTPRAARAAPDAFLAAAGTRALLMPRIRPISLGDEELTLLAGLAGLTSSGSDGLDLPPAVTPLERTLALMELVLKWRSTMASAAPDEHSAAGNTPAQAAALAGELARLMDLLETENVSLARIKDIVPDTYSDHWRKTVEFLRIVTEYWPVYLNVRGFSSPMDRRNQLILAEAERLKALPPKSPVIVAGVTGSVPATVTLMRAVAGLENGAIVLPALDMDLDTESWDRIVPHHPEHPQFGLKKLLDQLGLSRSDVTPLPGPQLSPGMKSRNAFISEAMRPSSTTARWHIYTRETEKDEIASALRNVALIEAPGAQDEAEAVALILREAVEVPGRTAALVSPDRLLARRVAIRLESWGIRVDDSAGRPFAKTVPGTFLNLVINAAVEDFAPAAVMALLKHPLCRLGHKAFDVRRFARALELIAFRAPYLGRGLDGIMAALHKAESDRAEGKHASRAASRLWQEDRTGAQDLALHLRTAYAPLATLYEVRSAASLKSFARAHIAVAEALATLPAEEMPAGSAANPLWQGEAGEAANNFFVGLLDGDMPGLEIHARDYGDLYQGLLAKENVRERTPMHPRVSIWGPFEARLQQPDVMVLGSLNEGTWPEAKDPGAWLNRPMRQELALPSPEEDIGRTAHDFVSGLGAARVYLTRAEKVKGVPTVPSRWLMRIKALLDGLGLPDALKPDKPWLAWARSRDHTDPVRRLKISAPAPKPPLDLRPRQMSVTRVEDWITNPYTVFARQILTLDPLPPLGLAPDQSLRGGLVHEVLSQFSDLHPTSLPADTLADLRAIAAKVLESYTGHPRVAAFWLPRLERFLAWFAETEPKRREHVSHIIAETKGSLVIDAPGGPFTLTARADRIDDAAGGLIITDYKTGAIPNAKAVESNRAPQLPLEAAIAMSGAGFPGLAGRTVQGLRYIRASGGEPPGEEKRIDKGDAAGLAKRALLGLTSLIAHFDDPDTPYSAVRRPGFRYDYDDYAHLARVAEWSAHVDEEI